jgi:hypothetical protein
MRVQSARKQAFLLTEPEYGYGMTKRSLSIEHNNARSEGTRKRLRQF